MIQMALFDDNTGYAVISRLPYHSVVITAQTIDAQLAAAVMKPQRGHLRFPYLRKLKTVSICRSRTGYPYLRSVLAVVPAAVVMKAYHKIRIHRMSKFRPLL